MLGRFFNKVLFVVLLSFSSVFVLTGQEEWVVFEEKEGIDFVVDAPAKLVKKTKDFETAIGPLTAVTYAHEGDEDDSNYLYAINIIEYPEGTFHPDSTELIDAFLDSAVESFVEGLEGEEVYQADISEVANGKGKLFRIKYSDEYTIIKGKTFLKNDIFITLQVYTTKNKSLNDEIDDFLNSFRVKF